MSVSNMSSEGNKYKVIVIGDPGVGKTALTFRFCEGQYRDNLKVTLNIWDTAGMEQNRMALTSHYYRNLNAVIFVYDVTKPKTFENLKHWLAEVEKEASEDVIKVLIGNKCDEEAAVDRQRAQQFADTHGLPLFETSAKLDDEKDNIEGVFLTIAHKLKSNSRLVVNLNALQLADTPPEQPQSGCSC
ncbi:putative Ras-related protein Rab-33 isoform X2 [Atheta coriaria]|uniref:putative Ras-related protein Rab-33 isoform X2 n=1 Tax=Dalotia coriaria TaxID=877792 RepID=UPI0031F36830